MRHCLRRAALCVGIGPEAGGGLYKGIKQQPAEGVFFKEKFRMHCTACMKRRCGIYTASVRPSGDIAMGESCRERRCMPWWWQLFT